MKYKMLLTALAFVAFTTAGMAGETAKAGCCKSSTECSKSSDAGKSKTEKSTKEVKNKVVKK